MIEINYISVLLATLTQFILGAFWYSPLLFGKWWMEIMEVSLSVDEMKKMQKQMFPFYFLQLVLTFLTTINLAILIKFLPQVSVYTISTSILLGFIVPTQIGAVIWANTKKKYWLKQIFVMVSYSLIGILLAAWILR